MQRNTMIRSIYPANRCGERRNSDGAHLTDMMTRDAALAEMMPLISMKDTIQGGGAVPAKAALSSRRQPSLSRGAVLSLAPLLLFPLSAPATDAASAALSPTSAATIQMLSLTEAVSLISAQCDPTFLTAVRTSGRLLYRGEALLGEPSLSAAARLCPPPDLLDAATYGNDADALSYFQTLEGTLARRASSARPSTGHIGVARRDAAAAWGAAVSVWPLGRLHYVWPLTRSDFWPLGEQPQEEQPGTTRTRATDEYKVDAGLAEALALGREVLFATEGHGSVDSAFAAVPAALDGELRRRLRL